MPEINQDRQRLLQLLGPYEPNDANREGYMNWILLGGSGQGVTYDDMKASAVYANNLIRAAVGVPPLQWDDGLANDAQNYANILAGKQGAVQTLEHSSNESRNNQGENLSGGYEWHSYGYANGSGANPNGNIFVNAILRWTIDEEGTYYKMSEKQHFDNQDGQVDGHYTQCIWKKTTHFGMGYAFHGAQDPNFGHQIIVVGRYSPPGNMAGQGPFSDY